MSKKVLWAIKQQTDNPKALDLYLYDKIKSDGEDWWTGETDVYKRQSLLFEQKC